MVKGNKMIAWEVTEEDVKTVVDAHDLNMTEEQISDVLDELDHDSIIEGLLCYTNMEDQTNSMLDDIENYFIEKEMVSQEDKIFFSD